MKALVGAFNQEKALVGAFSMTEIFANLRLTFVSSSTNARHGRGECGGRSGIFPASFVRIVSSFPGDAPGPGADPSSYLRAELTSGHEYDNTR